MKNCSLAAGLLYITPFTFSSPIKLEDTKLRLDTLMGNVDECDRQQGSGRPHSS
jgi:hypothetical protein